MNVLHQQRALDLFEQLIDLPPTQREAALTQQATEQEVLNAVRALLRADHDAPALITLQPLHDLDEAESETRLPDAIGGHEIIDLLGRGASGLVYRARQAHPPREVALKVLAPHLADRSTRHRLAREARILARLDHPHIARIISAGEDNATRQPYIVMELVRGTSLIDYARTHNLSLRDRLLLICQIADAVTFAHQRNVIHRDLKPSNILVESSDDGEPLPRVLDFGVARFMKDDATEATVATLAGALVGTLAYMSPEQIGADPDLEVDTRSDLYSLAVVGFELLTGALPVDVRNLPIYAALQKLRETSPEALSDRDPTLRGDLTRIFNVAMARDRERRYPSVAEFAADIRRFLANQPIHAREPSPLYVARKFVQRNRISSAIATLALLLTSTLVVQVQRADRAREATYEKLRNVTAFVTGDLVRQAETVTGTGPLRADIVDNLFDQVITLREDNPNDPMLIRAHAKLLGQRADLQADNRAAAAHDRRAQVALLRQVVASRAAQPEDEARLSIALVRLGDTLNADNLPGVTECYHEALAIDERLAANHPLNRHFLDNLAHSYIRMNWRAKHNHEHDTARDWLDQALVVAEKMLALDEEHPLTLHLMREIHVELAAVAEHHNDIEQILAHREHAIHYAERALTLSPDRPAFVYQVAQAHRSMGFGLRSVGELDRAEHHGNTALRYAEKLHRLVPNPPSHALMLAAALTDIARVHIARNDLAQAYGPARRASDLCLARAAEAECHPHYLARLRDVVGVFVHVARQLDALDDATNAARRMIAIYEDCVPALRPADALSLARLYNNHPIAKLRNPARSAQIARNIIAESAQPPAHAHVVLARALRLQGQTEQAAVSLNHARHAPDAHEITPQIDAEQRALDRVRKPRDQIETNPPAESETPSDG